MQDGLLSENIRAASVVGDVGSLATSITAGTTAIGAGEVGAAEQGFVQARGYCIQTGEGVMASGSAWVTFGSKFAAVPRVAATATNAAANAGALDVVAVKSTVAGSFYITGSPAAGSFYYIAVGSGGYT